MFISERQKKILEILIERQSIKIKELCNIFKSTTPTIRKDLQYLDKGGKLAYVRGGAYHLDSLKHDLPLTVRSSSMEAEKHLIAKKVINDLTNHLVIFMDGSTTTAIIASEIAKSNLFLTVITNSLEIANILYQRSNINVVLCGGSINREHSACISNKTTEDLNKYHSDIAILSCHGLSKEVGFMNGNIEIGMIKQIMANNSKQVWMCIDHTKFDRMGIIHLFDWDRVSCVYTNYLPKDWKTILHCVKTVK